MDKTKFSRPLSLKNVQITDTFWKKEMELVRTEVIPYQWRALNDKVEGAAPSFCMHNFEAAGRQNKERREKGAEFKEPVYTFRGFETLPEDPGHLEDKFYGFVFQDSDFYKWIEAVGYSLSQHPDEKLEAIADGAIDIVCKAQQENGYLDTYYILNGKDKIFTNLKDNHELYCLGHLLEGAVAYYDATGKDKLLNAAKRYADYVDSCFGKEEGKCKGYPGHEIAEMALVRLYETTGEDKYLNLARFFIDERGTRPYYYDNEHPEEVKKKPDGLRYEYNQAHKPVREQDEAVGHSVRAVYLYSGMADVARLTEDESLLKACEVLWNNMTRKKMYITGGIGATHIGEAFSFNYDLPNDTAYAETCASIGLVFMARRMLEMTPDAKYADVMERALYNGVLSGMALDGKSFFYVNPLEVLPEACHKDERKFHVKPVRQKWFGCACCPPNIARLLSSISTYAYTENKDTLFVHLYIGGIIKKQLDRQEIEIKVTSEFPWDGTVKVEMPATEKPFTLAFRIPQWAKNYQVKGIEGAKTEEKVGYLYVTKQWTGTETVELEFPMEVRLVQTNPKVRENIGKIAVVRGPIVYCLEEADNGADLHLVRLSPKAVCEVKAEKIAGEPVKTVLTEGLRQKNSENPEEEELYTIAEPDTEVPADLKFIPYYVWANRGENEMMVWVKKA